MWPTGQGDLEVTLSDFPVRYWLLLGSSTTSNALMVERDPATPAVNPGAPGLLVRVQLGEAGQFWAYILQNPKGRFYVGQTDDLDRPPRRTERFFEFEFEVATAGALPLPLTLPPGPRYRPRTVRTRPPSCEIRNRNGRSETPLASRASGRTECLSHPRPRPARS